MHKCPKNDCMRRVPSEQFACRSHWYAIPKPLRDEIWREYRREPLGKGHLAAMEAAETFLNAPEAPKA